MKDAINERFKIAVEYIISEKIAKNKAEIASAMWIKPNTFSEILNKRMSIGIQMIEPFCVQFGISVDWLITGQGPMLRNHDNINIGNGQQVVANHNNGTIHADNRQYYSDSPDVLRTQIDILEERIKEKDAQIKEKDAQIKEKDAQIKEKDAQIHRLIDIIEKK